jgi:hypothetical protein
MLQTVAKIISESSKAHDFAEVVLMAILANMERSKSVRPI